MLLFLSYTCRFSARALSCPLHFSAWKSKFTVRLLVTADDRSHFLMLLGQGKVEEIQAQVSKQLRQLKKTYAWIRSAHSFGGVVNGVRCRSTCMFVMNSTDQGL